MEISRKWIAYTTSYKEAKQYRMQYSKLMQNNGDYRMYDANFNMFYKHKTGRYILPVCLWKQYDVTKRKINFKTDLVLLDEQWKAVNWVYNLYKQWEKSAMIVSETATWKSYMLASVALKIWKPTVIVAPRKSILLWLKEKFWYAKIMTASDVREAKKLPDILLISAQSFNKVFEILNKNYDVLLLDETHRIPERRVQQINSWVGCFVMGVSWTPQRKEFDIEWFKMLFKNIHDTWLRALEAIILKYKYEYKYSIEEVMNASQWLPTTHPEVMRNLYINNTDRTERLSDIIRNMQYVWFKKMIIFTDRTKHINNIYEVLSKTQKNIFIIDWKHDIEKVLKDIKKLDSYILIWQTASAWEWMDIPPLQLGILFQSTSYINTVEQTVWRIKRKYWDKKVAFFIDFADYMQIGKSKKKVLWWYDRKKAYNTMRYEIKDLVQFLQSYKKNENTLL